MEKNQLHFNNLISSILKEGNISIEIKEFDLKENIKDETSLGSFKVFIKNLKDAGDEIEFTCQSEGKGFVDSLWSSTTKCLSEEFPILNELQFASFNIETNKGVNVSQTNGKASAKLNILNNRNQLFSFTSEETFSINTSAVITIQKALEFFINSEKAFRVIKLCLDDAKQRRRTDLVVKYTNDLSELVKIIDYSKVL